MASNNKMIVKKKKEPKSVKIIYSDWSTGVASIVQPDQFIRCEGYHCQRILNPGDKYTRHTIKAGGHKYNALPICEKCLPFHENVEKKDHIDLLHEYRTTTDSGQDLNCGPTIGEFEKGYY